MLNQDRYKTAEERVKAFELPNGDETVKDIVREMRNDAIAADAWHETHGEMASAASTLNRHYDSIESAWRREKAEREIIDRNAHTITADSTTYDEHFGVNAIVKEEGK